MRFDTGLEASELMEIDAVAARARAARDSGATRFCMGAAYRSPKPKDLRKVIAMIREVKALGLKPAPRLGMLTPGQALELKAAGLDFYNHNLDTSSQYYQEIISTRTYQDRLDTLQAVRDAGMNVCCGGIVGMGEEPQDRIELLHTLGNLARTSAKRAHQSVGARGGNAAGGLRGARSLRLRAHDRRGAHSHARESRAPVGGPGCK